MAFGPVAAIVLTILAADASFSGGAYAHIGFGASQTIKIEGDSVSVAVRINWDHVEALILPRDGEAVEAGARVLQATAAERGGGPCAGHVTRTLARMSADILAVDLVFECPRPMGDAQVYALRLRALEALGVHALQYIEIASGDRRDGFLRASSANLTFDITALGAPPLTTAYFALGLEHILLGIDHLAFLAALLLSAGYLRFALMLASVFAVTHALTLTLTALKIIGPNPNVVEPLIALSVAAAAVEGLRRKENSAGRAVSLVIAGTFGLVHGMGFGAGLADAGLPEGRDALAVLSFTAGIETAQVFLLAAAFAALKVLGRREMSTRNGLAIALALLGTFWFVEHLAMG
jgi:hydrogenase/urease accessory protein HupE